MIPLLGMKALASGFVRRASNAVAPVVDRVETIRYDAPPIRLSHGLIALAVIAVAWVGSLWWVKRERDALWRERIAASSASVRAAIGEGAAAAEAADEVIIKGLTNADDKLNSAEALLRDIASRPATEERDACRVPARCLGIGLRQQ